MKLKQILQTLGLASLLIIFLACTDPSKISLPLILIPYLLAALIIYRLAYLGLHGLLGRSINAPKLKLYALIITVLLTNFALLKSIGQLTLQDGLISGAIVVISVVYISKFSLKA